MYPYKYESRIKLKIDSHTSNLSSEALWFIGSLRNSSVKRMHSPTCSGETKSSATLKHDCKRMIHILTLTQTFQASLKRKSNHDQKKSELIIYGFNNLQETIGWCHHAVLVTSKSLNSILALKSLDM